MDEVARLKNKISELDASLSRPSTNSMASNADSKQNSVSFDISLTFFVCLKTDLSNFGTSISATR